MAAGNYHQPSWWFGIPPSVPRFRQPNNVGSQPRVVLGVSNGRAHPLLPTGENLSGRTSTKQKKCTVKLPIESDWGHGTKEGTGHVKQTKSLWSRTPTSHSQLPPNAFIRGQLEVITAEPHPEHIQRQGKASIIPVPLPSALQWDLMRQEAITRKLAKLGIEMEADLSACNHITSLERESSSLTSQHPRPSSGLSLPLRTSVRHPKYYYAHGNITFMIENILFKVFSLQIQADPGIKAYDFEPIVRDIMDCSDRSPSIPGASDSNPIFLPNVKIVEFVHLLELVLGRPYDKRYIKITTAAQSPKIDRPKYGARIMDAGVLATCFGMDQLDSWAQSQILQLLKLSPSSCRENWSQGLITKLALYIHDTRIPTYRRDILGWIMQLLRPEGYSLYSSEQIDSIFKVYLNIYRYRGKEFSTKCPALFGYVFIVLLWHGPGSEVWTNQLNREERLVMYAAHIELTYLSKHDDLETDWISQRTKFKSSCSPRCDTSFYEAMHAVFDLDTISPHAYSLKSPTPGDDIHTIIRIVSARWLFAEYCRKWRCSSKCGEKSLAKFDGSIERMLCRFTEKYKHYVRTA